MSESAELFYDTDRDFLKKLDSNPNLLVFQNGVYDLNRFEFRQGQPTDYVSLGASCDYIEYDESNEEFKETLDFFHKMTDQIFPNSKLKKYVLRLFGSFLSGNTRNEHFHIWYGTGANGKSVLTDLMQHSLGEYYCVLPIALLTKTRSASSGPQPELAVTKGKRFAILQEPSEGSSINAGLMKELTGGDTISCRGLYQEQMQFKPQFNLVLTCNLSLIHI